MLLLSVALNWEQHPNVHFTSTAVCEIVWAYVCMDHLCSLYIGMYVYACTDGQMRCQCWLPLAVLYFTQVSQIDHEGVQATALKVVCDLLLLYGFEAFKSSTEDDSGKVSMVLLQCGLTSNSCQKYLTDRLLLANSKPFCLGGSHSTLKMASTSALPLCNVNRCSL